MYLVFIICFLTLQVSASFYDELHGAMHSIQRGFGKLLSDVVIDVSDTVHCTISAVEHVLTLNGLMRAKSSYGHKCRDRPLLPIDINQSNDPLRNFFSTRDALEGKRYLGATHHDVHRAISKVNATLIGAFDNHDNRRKIKSISKVLKDETEQLEKVSNMLRQELHSISKNVNVELNKFNNDFSPSVWSELENRNRPPLEVHQHSGNPLIDKQGTHPHEAINSDQKLKEPSNDDNPFNDAKREFDLLRDVAQDNSPTINFPKTFKEVAKNIREKDKVHPNADANKKHESGSIFDLDNKFDQFSPFYDPGSSSSDGHKHDLDEALSVIKDSEHNDRVLEMLKQSHSGTDVFSSGKNLFNF